MEGPLLKSLLSSIAYGTHDKRKFSVSMSARLFENTKEFQTDCHCYQEKWN